MYTTLRSCRLDLYHWWSSFASLLCNPSGWLTQIVTNRVLPASSLGFSARFSSCFLPTFTWSRTPRSRAQTAKARANKRRNWSKRQERPGKVFCKKKKQTFIRVLKQYTNSDPGAIGCVFWSPVFIDLGSRSLSLPPSLSFHMIAWFLIRFSQLVVFWRFKNEIEKKKSHVRLRRRMISDGIVCGGIPITRTETAV